MKDEEGKVSSVKISLKYIPVQMKLDPSESINNMGNLRVDVLNAQDLPPADANGKSDPYCKFELNSQEVFKTKTLKKTLNPEWNEFFEVSVPSRTSARFKVNVYDYDFADRPDFLGSAAINLAPLEPFKAQELKLPLDGKSGFVRLRLLFRPDYIVRTRQGSSTFHGTFAAPGKIVTGVAGAPIKGGAAVAGAVGHGVGKGASFIKRGFRGRRDEDEANGGTTPNSSQGDLPIITTNGADTGPLLGIRHATGLNLDTEPSGEAPGPANGGGLGHARTKSFGAASIHSLAPGAPGAGTAVFTVVSASGYPPSSDLYVAINQLAPKHKTIGKTKHHKSHTGTVKFDETFRVTCTPDTQFQIQAKEQHTFSSDDDLGEAAYFVDESSAALEKELKVGNGHVILKSTFTPSDASDSPKSALRRSFVSKRESRASSREPTP